LRLWDITTRDCLYAFTGDIIQVNAITFSPNGNLLASANENGTVWLCDTTIGACLQTLEASNYSMTDVAFSPDGKTLASASYDRTVRTWDVTSGDWKQTFKTKEVIENLLYSKDGRHLITTSQSFSADGCSKISPGLLTLNSESSNMPNHLVLSVRAASVNDERVAKDGQNILCFPPDYGAECFAIYNEMLAVGHSSGQITFLELSIS
jgi:WD40 repeat protein